MSELNNVDRTGFVPRHEGSHVLPNSPLFSQLLRHARRDHVAIKDQQLDIARTFGDILDAVLCLRAVVQAALPSEVLTQLEHGEEVYIGVLAAGGYEFAIAALAVLALGAALVPIFPAAPLEEVVYFSSKSQQVLILTSVATTKLAHQAAQRCQLPTISILPNLLKKTHFTPLDMSISSNAPQDPSAPGVVIFTSGTMGKPKGVVLRRTYTHEAALAIGDGFGINHNDVLLHVLPVHHTTGLGTKFDAASVLKRWLKGGLTVFSAVPTVYMRLKWHIEQLPRGDQLPYKQSSKQFRAFLCGSSALQDNVLDFWTATRGQPILTRYGATEIPGCLRVPPMVAGLPKGCVLAGARSRIEDIIGGRIVGQIP